MSETRAKVFEVADALLADGVRPTQQNVRERIGSGSLTTINKGLNEWWSALGKRLTDQQAGQDIPEAVVRLSTRLWNEALANAERRYQSVRQEALGELSSERDTLTQERMKFSSQLAELNEIIIKQKRIIDEQEVASKVQAKLLLDAQDECYRLTREVQACQDSLAGYDPEEATESRVKLKILTEELERLQNQNLQLRAENAQLKQRQTKT